MITDLDQVLNPALDQDWLGNKFARQLSNDFVHQIGVGHILPVLHNAHNACL